MGGRGLADQIPVPIILSGWSQGHGSAYRVLALECQRRGHFKKSQKSLPRRLLQHDCQGTLAELPALPEDTLGALVLDLVAHLLDARADPVTEQVHVGLSDDGRVPDVDDAVNCLANIFSVEGDQEKYDVARHNVKVPVVEGHLDLPIIVLRHVRDGLDDVSQISRGC